MKSILDPTFQYTSSLKTDVRKTFARIRRELKARDQARASAEAEGLVKAISLDVRRIGSRVLA
jgi:hypothetical protein